jgi:hypothetical protein
VVLSPRFLEVGHRGTGPKKRRNEKGSKIIGVSIGKRTYPFRSIFPIMRC